MGRHSRTKSKKAENLSPAARPATEPGTLQPAPIALAFFIGVFSLYLRPMHCQALHRKKIYINLLINRQLRKYAIAVLLIKIRGNAGVEAME